MIDKKEGTFPKGNVPLYVLVLNQVIQQLLIWPGFWVDLHRNRV